MDMLQAPPTSNQLTAQPVEELRVRGSLPLGAEVIGGWDQSPAEVLLPDPIYGHARRQGVFGRDQPACEIEPGGTTGSTQATQKLGYPGLYFQAGSVPLPPQVDMGPTRSRATPDDLCPTQARKGLFESIQLLAELLELRLLKLLFRQHPLIILDEELGEQIGIPGRPFAGVGMQDALSIFTVVHIDAQDVVAEIPEWQLSRRRSSLSQFFLPGRLKIGHSVLTQELPFVPFELGKRLQIGSHLTRKRCVDIDLLRHC